MPTALGIRHAVFLSTTLGITFEVMRH
jgi:hypothetical protein